MFYVLIFFAFFVFFLFPSVFIIIIHFIYFHMFLIRLLWSVQWSNLLFWFWRNRTEQKYIININPQRPAPLQTCQTSVYRVISSSLLHHTCKHFLLVLTQIISSSLFFIRCEMLWNSTTHSFYVELTGCDLTLSQTVKTDQWEMRRAGIVLTPEVTFIINNINCVVLNFK